MAEALRPKLAKHLGQMMATVEQDTGSISGRLSESSADRIADAVIGVVRKHDEERPPVRLYDVPDDPELAAMAALLPALPLVSKLGCDARDRVMDWARRRATDGLPPF